MGEYHRIALHHCGVSTTVSEYEAGKKTEREHAIMLLEKYFELTQFSCEHEKAAINEDWDNGFQAAIAILKGNR